MPDVKRTAVLFEDEEALDVVLEVVPCLLLAEGLPAEEAPDADAGDNDYERDDPPGHVRVYRNLRAAA